MPSITHIALLRGLNVGAANRIKMPALIQVFESVGCTDVTTYVQSGNVLFRATAAVAKSVSKKAADALAKQGIRSPVVLRTAAEMKRIAARHPLAQPGDEPTQLAVAYLADTPTATQVAGLEPDRSPGDTFVVIGADVFMRLPNGFADTKLTNQWLDSRLKTVSTARNWKTVQALAALVDG